MVLRLGAVLSAAAVLAQLGACQLNFLRAQTEEQALAKARGGPIAVAPPSHTTDEIKERVSAACRSRFQESVSMAVAQRSVAGTPARADDAAECNSMVGRVCDSRANFVEDLGNHRQRKPSATLSVWDLSTHWKWCFPKECSE